MILLKMSTTINTTIIWFGARCFTNTNSSYILYLILCSHFLQIFVGGDTIVPDAGVIIGGICTGLSPLSSGAELELEV